MINDVHSLQTHSLMMMFLVNNAVHTQAFSRNLKELQYTHRPPDRLARRVKNDFLSGDNQDINEEAFNNLLLHPDVSCDVFLSINIR